MTIDFACSACGSWIEAPDDFAGRLYACASCHTANNVPAAAEPVDSIAPDEPFKRPGVVTAIGALDIFGGVLSMFAALVSLLGALTDLFLGGGEPGIDAVAGLLIGALGGTQIAAGIGLWTLRPYGRKLQIILSTIGLIAIPIGTLISALILYYLYRPGVKVLFSGKSRADLTAQEREDLAKVGGGRETATAIIVVGVAFVFFCGLVSAIAIPNLLHAINRGRQKRSMADTRTIATAIEAYRVDHGLYPAGLTSTHDLDEFLTPTYLPAIPRTDGWRTPYAVWSSDDGTEYSIVSFGRDKKRGVLRGGATWDFDADMVLENGEFVQWAEETDFE